MRTPHLAAALLCASLSACATAREQAIRDLEPRSIAPSRDLVNQQARATVDGLVMALTIDGGSVRLDHVTLARIPRSAVRQGGAGDDRVTAVGYADGVRVSEASAPDAVMNTQEGVGLVRLTRRQVVLSIPAPRALDTVEVSAPATGATARVDVRAAYAPYCREYSRENRYCPSPRRPQIQ